MLKRRDSLNVAGRPKEPWFEWKRDPFIVDCVLTYAQRGHGKRSSFYSDYTSGCQRRAAADEAELVPVGKAYFGFSDAELMQLDCWVRENMVEHFGPVRAVAPVWSWRLPSMRCKSRHVTSPASPCGSRGCIAVAGTRRWPKLKRQRHYGHHSQVLSFADDFTWRQG